VENGFTGVEDTSWIPTGGVSSGRSTECSILEKKQERKTLMLGLEATIRGWSMPPLTDSRSWNSNRILFHFHKLPVFLAAFHASGGESPYPKQADLRRVRARKSVNVSCREPCGSV